MDAFLISTGLVAIAEIGDKTQLLALLLAARFQRPWPIIAGIFIATLANHALAAGLGAMAAAWLQGPWTRWVLGGLFLAFAAWALIPDRLEDGETPAHRAGASIFWTTTVAFFLVEMGDKTQIATVALGAQFKDVLGVSAGTTLGMMLANTPVVLAGQALAGRVPLKVVRGLAALAFALIGLWILIFS